MNRSRKSVSILINISQSKLELIQTGPGTRHHIEFPKTHVIRRLLILPQPVAPAIVRPLDEASWLSPFGAEIRYPGDRAETLPGDQVRAYQLAHKVRDAVMAVLDPYLSRLGGNTTRAELPEPDRNTAYRNDRSVPPRPVRTAHGPLTPMLYKSRPMGFKPLGSGQGPSGVCTNTTGTTTLSP